VVRPARAVTQQVDTIGAPLPRTRVGSVALVAAYAVLGLTLAITRTVGLARSYWLDEIVTVQDVIRPGLSEILAGPRVNHELFSILGWGTISLVGESEIALRLWSVIPFVAAVAGVTVWLHRRVGALSGVLFVFFCTLSPLLLDITRQARGYGLAFLAMAALVVTALETERTGRTSLIVLFCVAGVAGTWTLPHFGIAFVAMGLVLLANYGLRNRMAIGLAISTLACVAFYAPHFTALREGSEQEYSASIQTLWLLTAPIDQILVPALAWIDGTVLVPGLVWVPVVAGLVVVLVSSPLLQARRSALILGVGTVVTVVALWITGVDVVPRFLSYLLVPLLMLLATGIAAIVSRLPSRPPIVRTLIAVGVLATTFVVFVRSAPDVLRLPREAHRDAAAAILENALSTTPVFAYMTRPQALEFYLGRPVVRPASASDASVCDRRELVALVVQPWVLPTAEFTCMERAGTTRYRFEQYARGGEIAVWIIPARP
jgi:hypothetical protein